MGWFSKIFKKDKKMTAEQLQSIHDSLSTVPVFQWIKTERAGTVCNFQSVTEDEGIIFVEFNDGSRINYNLMDEMMMKLGSVSEALDMGGDPQPALDQPNNIGQAKIRTVSAPIVAENPIHALLKKQKSNTVGVDISLELNMPPKELYKVLEVSFENAQDEIVEFIVADINIDNIRASVKEAIKKFYE